MQTYTKSYAWRLLEGVTNYPSLLMENIVNRHTYFVRKKIIKELANYMRSIGLASFVVNQFTRNFNHKYRKSKLSLSELFHWNSDIDIRRQKELLFKDTVAYLTAMGISENMTMRFLSITSNYK